MSNPKRETLDVRSAIAQGQEPFAQIMAASEGLTGPGDQLVLIAPFEPAPLFRVMERQGFTHESSARADGSFEVVFTRK